MAEEWIESRIPDLTGVSLEELRNSPAYAEIAERLADELRSLPDDGIIVCTQPLRIEGASDQDG